MEQGAPKEICRKYNHQKRLRIHLTTGEDRDLPQNPTSAEEVSALLLAGAVETIHSSEPSLETVFLELTGRKLQEEA